MQTDVATDLGPAMEKAAQDAPPESFAQGVKRMAREVLRVAHAASGGDRRSQRLQQNAPVTASEAAALAELVQARKARNMAAQTPPSVAMQRRQQEHAQLEDDMPEGECLVTKYDPPLVINLILVISMIQSYALCLVPSSRVLLGRVCVFTLSIFCSVCSGGKEANSAARPPRGRRCKESGAAH